jgi:hypothetical protein
VQLFLSFDSFLRNHKKEMEKQMIVCDNFFLFPIKLRLRAVRKENGEDLGEA